MKQLFALAALLVASSLPCGQALAVTAGAPQNAQNVPYVIGFVPLNSQSQPYLGQMHLTFNDGIISGTYSDISIKPGSPFANAWNVPVTGGVSGGHLTLIIRQVTFRGTMKGTWMSGSATIRGKIFTFEAEKGSPGSGR